MLTCLSSVVASFVSLYLYANHYEEEEENEGEKLNNATLQFVMAILCGSWIVSAGVFFSSVKREYLHSFWSFDSTSSFRRKLFLSYCEDEDESKSRFLKSHPDT